MPASRLTADELATWRAFLEAHARVVLALDRQLAAAGCGLDLREYDVLVQLEESGEAGLRPRELVKRILISPSNITRRVDGLVARELVERRADPVDGRGVIVALTPAGRQALRRAATVHLAGVKQLVFSNPEADLAAVRRFLAPLTSS